MEDEYSRITDLQSISAQLSEANQYQAAIQVADAIVGGTNAPVIRSAAIANAITSAIANGSV